MEISIVILSCVILGLNPEMPVFYTFNNGMYNLNGFRQIKYIHTYIDLACTSSLQFLPSLPAKH